jgi:tetratricopeptide (TPR) repeat protein
VNLGGVYARQGLFEKATESYEHALRIARQLGDRYSEALALQSLGKMLLESSGPAEARAYFTEALAIFADLNTPEADKLRRLLESL